MTADKLDRVFKALADPVRRRIVDQLRARPNQSLFELCATSVAEDGKTISRQAVTQHLDMLEKAGLVEIAWSGRTRIHTLNLAPLHDAARLWLNQHLEEGQVP